MWSFKALRENASGLLRRATQEEKHEESYHPIQKDAMNNLVTPRNIVEFTLPPMRNHESLDNNAELAEDEAPSLKNLQSNLQVSEFEYVGVSSTVSNDDLKHSNQSSSAWNLKAKIHKKKPDSRSGSPAPRHSSVVSIIEPVCDSPPRKPKVRQNVENPGMSLQHLVERKDGFDLLCESPNTKRKESLFHMQNENNSLWGGKNGGNRSLIKPLREEETFTNIGCSPQASPKTLPGKAFLHRAEHRSSFSENFVKNRPHSYAETCSSYASECEESQTSRNDSDEDNDVNSTTAPSLYLRLTHLPKHKRLDVLILEGKCIHWSHHFYFKVSLLPRDDYSRTDVIKPEDANPKINEKVSFDNVGRDEIPYMLLKIFCKEKVSRIRHADVLGVCIIPLFNINFIRPYESWVTLEPFEREDYPHLLLSLCYDDMLACLTIDVLAARSLPKGKLGKLPDTFVTLTEHGLNTNSPRRNTKTVHRSQNPVFRESFLFSLDKLDQPDLLSIVVSVFKQDRVRGPVELVGSVKLGQHAESSLASTQYTTAVIKHWQQTVTCWHPLTNHIPEF